MKRSVVITGMESITSLGYDLDHTWDSLLNGISGIDKIDRFDVNAYPCQFGGEIKNFSGRKFGLTGTNVMLKYNQYELYAVMKAIDRYKWRENIDFENCPVYLGNQAINLDQELYDTLIKIAETTERFLDVPQIGRNLNKFPPLNGIRLLPTLPSHFIAKDNNIHGSANITYSGATSSIDALLHAERDIEMGYYEQAIVASTYTPFSAHEFLWISNLRISRKTNIEDNARELIYPFDRRHNGIVYGEGAGVILVETEESARKNNRKVLARLKGGATNVFPEDDFWKLSDTGFTRNLINTLEESELASSEIDLIYSNGTSYADWDNAEIKAIDKIWHDDSIAITSTKPNIGYLGCASGLIDCIFAIKSLSENKFAKILNFSDDKSELNGDISKYFSTTPTTIDKCLINSAGAGGQYSSIIIEKSV